MMTYQELMKYIKDLSINLSRESQMINIQSIKGVRSFIHYTTIIFFFLRLILVIIQQEYLKAIENTLGIISVLFIYYFQKNTKMIYYILLSIFWTTSLSNVYYIYKNDQKLQINVNNLWFYETFIESFTQLLSLKYQIIYKIFYHIMIAKLSIISYDDTISQIIEILIAIIMVIFSISVKIEKITFLEKQYDNKKYYEDIQYNKSGYSFKLVKNSHDQISIELSNKIQTYNQFVDHFTMKNLGINQRYYNFLYYSIYIKISLNLFKNFIFTYLIFQEFEHPLPYMAVSLFDLLFVLIHEDNNERQSFKITAISNKGKPDEQKLKILIMKQQENYQNIIFLRINVLDVEEQLELMKSREIMFNSIQHDVKNPLFAGSLLIQMIITKYLIGKELQIDNLYSLKYYFDISLSLINGYFDFTLAQIGNLKIQPEHFLLHEPIINIIKMMQHSAQKQSVHLTSLYNNKKTFARNDVKRLSQVLMNLINNAIKFTKNGGQVIIEVEEFLYKNLIYINVIDTGIGMNAEILNKIGQLYTTFNNNNMNRFGTGIGLYTSIKTVGVLGPLEKIFISSVEGIGSEFSFLIYVNAHDQLIKSKIERFNNDIKQILLYLRQDEILVDQTPSFTDIYIAEEQYAILDTRITTQYHMMINNNITNHNKKRKMIILVVDDEEIIRIATINAIKQLGKQNFQFYQAKNGQVGVEIFQELNKNDSNSFIDLIFTDIQMPELDGYEMVKQINELIEKNDYKKPEIIALSSNCSDQFDQNCKALNIDQNYYKPQNSEQIRDIIRNFLKKQDNLLQNQNSQ